MARTLARLQWRLPKQEQMEVALHILGHVLVPDSNRPFLASQSFIYVRDVYKNMHVYGLDLLRVCCDVALHCNANTTNKLYSGELQAPGKTISMCSVHLNGTTETDGEPHRASACI